MAPGETSSDELESIDDVAKRLTVSETVENIDTLLENGDNPAILLNYLPKTEIAKHLDSILDHGVSIDELMDSGVGPRLTASGISENLNTLLEHGADIDVNDLATRLNNGFAVYRNLTAFVENGMTYDRENILGYYIMTDPDAVADNLDLHLELRASVSSTRIVGILCEPYYRDQPSEGAL